jgi:hypothetical protein
MSHITHFEIYGEDPEALADFYRAVLGWRIEKLEGLAYYRIEPEAGATAAIGGGFTTPSGIGAAGWLAYVKVDSIDAVLAAAEARGARLLKPKTAVPRTAWIAILEDPAGNRFAVWQPDASAFPPLEPD